MRALHIDKSISNRDVVFNIYMTELDVAERISAEEEIVLAKKIRNGDKAALDRLVRANLLFVVSVAKKYQNKGLPLTDLINEGNLGLITAAHKFDETRGFKFISYAVWWIRQAMMSALSEHSRMVRLPANMVKNTADVRAAAERLEVVLERQPTFEEIIELSHVPGETITMEYAFAPKNASLHSKVDEDGDAELWSLIADTGCELPGEELERMDVKDQVKELLWTLDERERRVLEMYFGFSGLNEKTFREIGAELGISGELARQAKMQAIYKLQHYTRRRRQEYV